MNNNEKQQSFGDRDVDDQHKSTEDSSSVSRGEASTDAVSGSSSTTRNGNGTGLAARLTDLFVGDGDNDDDLLIQRNAQGTDIHAMGACRADERLKPLLKLNVSSGVAEDRLLSHLSQHFEPSEVGLLARCLCVPLVSVRVGKVDKQGTLLIPNSARGNLTLSLLSTSDLRISFLGDDGHVERILTLRNISDCSSVVIEGISADNSGRSFTIRVPNADPFYFWCSEKSILLGNELLEKMKKLLEKKPSLADLTGISDSRLECFVDRLRTYLVGSNTQASNTTLVSITSKSSQSKSSRGRTLSPRPNSFKDGPPRNSIFLKKISLLNPNSFSVITSNSNPSVKPKAPKSTIDTHIFPLVIEPIPLCPPVTSSTVAPDSFTLPPLSSSAFLAPKPALNLDEIPSFLTEPIPIFTPLMTDSIVHIPVLDICSSGPAYLVSAGPTMGPMSQETDSMAEKSARDTLRLLISGSSQLPSVLADVDHTIANSIAAMGLVSLTERSGGVVVDFGGTCLNNDELNSLDPGAGESQ